MRNLIWHVIAQIEGPLSSERSRADCVDGKAAALTSKIDPRQKHARKQHIYTQF